MNSSESIDSKKEHIYCGICHEEINTEEKYEHHAKVLCENCCINIRTRRVRKTHWQYLRSIKTGYLIPPERL